jgi:ribonuclease P protein component
VAWFVKPPILFCTAGIPQQHPKRPLLFFGALTPKRWAKRAVTRNLIKRQIYEVSALYAHELTPTAHVVRLRAEFDKRHFVSASSLALKKAARGELTQLFELLPKP